MIVQKAESEAGHWYNREGQPAYKIIGKNGQERNTTLRDARQHDLVPSVTTILNIVAKPGLNTWMQQQVLLAALTLPRQDGEHESDWLDRVMSDARSTGKDAAERGTKMHGELEAYYQGQQRNYAPYVKPVVDAVREHFGNETWIAEKSFAHESGFGGKVDLASENVVIDFKSKAGSLEKVTAYHEHAMQLAAYRVGLKTPNARCANVFFNEEGDVKVIEHSAEDLDDAYHCFALLLAFYRRKNKI